MRYPAQVGARQEHRGPQEDAAMQDVCDVHRRLVEGQVGHVDVEVRNAVQHANNLPVPVDRRGGRLEGKQNDAELVYEREKPLPRVDENFQSKVEGGGLAGTGNAPAAT